MIQINIETSLNTSLKCVHGRDRGGLVAYSGFQISQIFPNIHPCNAGFEKKRESRIQKLRLAFDNEMWRKVTNQSADSLREPLHIRPGSCGSVELRQRGAGQMWGSSLAWGRRPQE